MKVWLSLVASALFVLLLVAAVFSYVFALGNLRTMRTLLFASGAVAVLAAPYVASGFTLAGNWLAVVPNRPHPVAVACLGLVLCALAAFLMLEV